MCCFLAAEELQAESKKACLAFCLADPITRFGADSSTLNVPNKSFLKHWTRIDNKFYFHFNTVHSYRIIPPKHAVIALFLYSLSQSISFHCSISSLRVPPPWGAMQHLHKKIPETASKKSQMYGYLLDQEK